MGNSVGDRQRKDVALFVDFENVYISVRAVYEQNPNFESIIEKAQEYGRLIIARAYADWYRYQRVTNALYANGIEPVYVPTYYYGQERKKGSAIKNSVDIHMVIDAMRTVYTHSNIDTYIFVTGDRDFIPLINAIRQKGKECIVVGVAEAASSHLAQSADEFIFYHQLVDNLKPPKPLSDPYPVLVDAVKLARQRGNVPTFATLKLLMVELLGEFDQSNYKDKSGKAFSKFKDFVKEAERRGHIQIFTSGTVNEIFLPGENPLELSQFAQPAEEATSDEASGSDFENPFELLIEAVHLARKRNNLCTMATLKVLMKDLKKGFNEGQYTDSEGKPFSKFKDFLLDAEKRGVVQILTTGTVDEVFLPGEDAQKLSRFANRKAEDPRKGGSNGNKP
ncbi:MAG: NYN domain-containing protein [Ardenticatenaceae bacterium]|nr:NYN domain-containing protein [Ardenticatenaceae bacterium]HBY97902.1 hypothetical protein [Chloroflexota bacterium]